jgi:Asp-tRNA(Asn)/Glu-tRNA(Gln) amidotransferase C subunit
MSSFLFHEVSEKEKEEIRKQIKHILEDFSKKLSELDKKIEESEVEREEFERKEGEIRFDESFSRKTMFENAPDKSKDFIVAEKKKW